MLIILLFLTACSGVREEEMSLEDEDGKKEEASEQQESEGVESEKGEGPAEEVKDDEENEVTTGDEKKAEEDKKADDDPKEKATMVLSLEEIQERYKGQSPEEWGENITGVKTRINTEAKIVALTFDACGGPNGRGYDEALIAYLIDKNIPATLFISGDWMEHHPDRVAALWENPNFDIANHGKDHKPLSVSGQSAYGIPGTASVEEVYQEVYQNHVKIKELTGHTSKFFRSGTAYYDEVAAKIVEDLGEIPVNYNVLGDAGATFTATQIQDSMIQANEGSIMLFHMNHPDSDVAKGVQMGVEALLEEGFEFVLLRDYIEELQ